MSFLTVAALAVGLLVVAPLLAHLLRRRPPEEQPFAGTTLVPATAAIAQRRTALEDRALFIIRALAVLALAVLGATPFVTCSRLSLARDGGASVALAIVVDDSMSMRAAADSSDPESLSRFEEARKGAEELLAGMQEGDAVSVVLAGRPPRVALASTTNLEAVRETLAGLPQTDRGTDLEGAVQLAGELVGDLRHVDKRVVVLSDMADGGPEAPALEAPAGTKLWIPLEQLRGARGDCAVVSAERRTGGRISIRLACGTADPAAGEARRRKVQVVAGEKVLEEAPFRVESGVQDISLSLSDGGSEAGTTRLFVRITGDDAISVDDRAPVVSMAGELRVGVVADAAESAVATGGPPPVEQAFSALGIGVQLRPLSTVPDRAEELEELGLLIADDVPGFTPSQRRALGEWVERGGVLLVTLGPTAAAAPIGQSFDPLVPALVKWDEDAPAGIDLEDDALFGDTSVGMDALDPAGRAAVVLDAPDAMRSIVSWKDGEPFVLEQRLGRGLVRATTLPFDTGVSDFALRPGFLELLEQVAETARTLGGSARTTVGMPWTLEGFDEVKVSHRVSGDEYEPIEVERVPGGGSRRVVPERVGLYRLVLDGSETMRVAAVDEREVDLRPRAIAEAQADESLGGVEASIDASPYVAVFLLALMVAELVMRAVARRRVAAGEQAEAVAASEPEAPRRAA